MIDRETFFKKPYIVFLLALLSCALWGSAFPCVKIGYTLFGIGGEAPSSLLYAGVRFCIAGVLILGFCSIKEKKLLLPKRKKGWLYVFLLALTQTIGQYIFYYLGLYQTAGVKASVINGAGVFLSILMACFLFRQEKFTLVKLIGCLAGFGGVVLVNLGKSFDFSFSFTGEGFLLLSCLFSALAGNLSKEFAKEESPVLLSGWQFLIGGAVLSVAGLSLGGRLYPQSPWAFVMLLYLAIISAVAFSLMGILLKYNAVSRVSSYKTLTPVIGFVLSALILKEGALLRIETLLALILVAIGIFLINRYGEVTLKKRGKTG
ncbi:MAG: DMT family transporter [Clostridia bacterium]|nr:DMT family transporter [Clostridia bacterium]